VAKQEMTDIFISYARQDQHRAKTLAEALSAKGWVVWWDPQLQAGEHFDDVIEQALADAKCVIVIWSEHSIQSRYVKDEASYALNRNKLLPIAIDKVELPFRFEGLHTEQLLDWRGSKAPPAFQKLVADIATRLGPPPIKAEATRKTKEIERRQAEAKAIFARLSVGLTGYLNRANDVYAAFCDQAMTILTQQQALEGILKATDVYNTETQKLLPELVGLELDVEKAWGVEVARKFADVHRALRRCNGENVKDLNVVRELLNPLFASPHDQPDAVERAEKMRAEKVENLGRALNNLEDQVTRFLADLRQLREKPMYNNASEKG
jgi:hypothetical protein